MQLAGQGTLYFFVPDDALLRLVVGVCSGGVRLWCLLLLLLPLGVRTLAAAGAFALPRLRLRLRPCPWSVELEPSAATKALPPREGVSGDRDEYWSDKY